MFLPSATTIRKGGFHWRVVHVAREVVYEDTTTNLLGMDDSVKLGLQVGYGISERLDVTLQRSNGRTLQVGTTGKPVNMDYWDMLFKYKLLDQNDGAKDSGGLADIAVVAGTTYMLRNHTKSKASLDLQVVAERNFFSDRLRLGIGLAYAGLSTYEAIPGLGSATKLFPDEYDALANPSFDRPENRSAAIPFTCKIALSERWQLFSEMVVPVAGWRTHDGPATAAGLRFNTHTHEYSFYFSNTANTAFNGVVTGGADRWSNLPVFGFNIIGHL